MVESLNMNIPKAISDFLNELLNIILEPIINWIRSLGTVKKFLCAITILIVVFAIYWQKEFGSLLSKGQDYYKIFTYSPTKIPLSDYKQKQLDGIISNISYNLINVEYNKKEKNPEYYNPWAISQIIVSSQYTTTSLVSNYLAFIKRSDCFVPSCSCFSEYKNPGYGNTIATSWVMLAYGKQSLKIDDTLFNYVVNTQNNNGWWSLYPSQKEEDASTLATAFFALALDRVLKNIKDDVNAQKGRNAVLKALSWLESQYNNTENVWEDYPNASDGKEVIAINGVILHVINQLEKNKEKVKIYNLGWINKFEDYKDYLQNKPQGFYKIKSSMQSSHAITISNKGLEKDAVNNYDLPWFITATIDAYPEADIRLKIKILDFSNQIIDQAWELYQNCMKGVDPQPWLASEFLISLRTINNEKVL